jgi:hypothetical protein
MGFVKLTRFKPVDVEKIELWLDSTGGLFQNDSLTIPAVTDNDPIQVWQDKSGKERHFSTTGFARPTLKTSIQNNLNIVRFNGTSNYMQLITSDVFSFLESGSASIFMVLKVRVDPNSGSNGGITSGHPLGFLRSISTLPGTASHYPWSDGNIYDGTLTSSRKNCGNPTLPLTSFHLYNLTAESNLWKLSLNKTVFFTSPSNTLEARGRSLGASSSTGGALQTYWYDGDLAELIIFSNVVSSSNQKKIEKYLYDKWAIA